MITYIVVYISIYSVYIYIYIHTSITATWLRRGPAAAPQLASPRTKGSRNEANEFITHYESDWSNTNLGKRQICQWCCSAP